MAIRTKPPQWHQQFTTWTPDYVTGPAGEEDTRNGGAYALPAASPAGDGHGVRSPGAACPSATRHGWRGASSYMIVTELENIVCHDGKIDTGMKGTI